MNIRVFGYGPNLRTCLKFCFAFAITILSPFQAGGEDNFDEALTRGRTIYRESCEDCHGSVGQGEVGAYEKELTGDLSVKQLARLIAQTMPEDDPGSCVGDDALAVAQYIHHEFYSEAAQVRDRPPQLTLTRLTAEQTRQSLADLYASFEWTYHPNGKQGLTAEYFKVANLSAENKVLQRIDPVVDFDFGRASPGLEMPLDDFAIHWYGGLKPDVSGRYEIVIHSTCAFDFHLGRYDRILIDNHVQSGDHTEFRQEIFLTSGRAYPVQLTFIQRKRKTELPPAKISVAWVPPGGTEQIIPPSNWVPDHVPHTFSLQTLLPPDDRSYGYPRGIGVDRQWDESLSAAITEFSQAVASELWPDYQKKHAASGVKGRDLLSRFLRELLSVAFRHELTDDVAAILVDKQLESEADDRQAIQRVLLLGLKSPRFLYPYVDLQRTQSERVGTRMALTLLDSLPVDDQLRKAIQSGELTTEEQIRSMATYLLEDYRARAKLRSMLAQWLNIEQPVELRKQTEQFAGFDSVLVSDLRSSLDAFLNEVVWSDASDYRQFFAANWGYTSPRIEKFYGSAWSPFEPFPIEPGSHPLAAESEIQPGAPTEQSGEGSGANGDGAPTGDDPKPDAAEVATTPIQPAVFVGFQRTGEDSRRHGILTHPYMMSRLAYHDATSPIHRGVFLIRYVLGRILQPPQDAFTPLSPDLHPNLTTRQRIELQTGSENCQTCHSRINGLGYSLEHWDAVGRFKETDRNQPVDASGSYVNRDGDEIQFKDIGQLADYLASSRDACEAFVRRAFHHFVQQPPAAYGEDTLEKLTDRFVDNDYNVRKLVVEIAVIAALHNPTTTSPP